MVRSGRNHIVREVTTTPAPRGVPGFGSWVARECPPGGRVLNIGAGRNLSGKLPALRRRAGRIVGVDPDPAVLDNPTLDEWHHMTLEEYAAADPEPFDLAFSVFVLEHVRDPRAFTEACARLLRPGGVLMGLTVNKWHFFGLATWATTRLGVADSLLRRIRGPEVAHYHFPTEYRINTVGATTRHLERAGFECVTFRCWDLPSMYQPYLPDRVKGFAETYDHWAYRIGVPYLMGHLTFRARLHEAAVPLGGPHPPVDRLAPWRRRGQ